MFIIAKIFTFDYKPRLKESMYFVLISLFMTFVYIQFFEVISRPYNLFLNPTLVLFLFLYFYKGKSYTHQMSIVLSVITVLVNVIYFAIALTFIAIFNLSAQNPVLYWFTMLLIYSTAIITAGLTAMFLRNLLNFMSSTPNLQNTFMLFSSVSFVTAVSLGLLIDVPDLGQVILGWRPPAQTTMLEIIALIYIIINFIITVIIIKFTESRITLQQKESEQMALQLYVDEIERHNISAQKFEQDYQNILLTIDGFINDDDMSGLKQYYHSNLKKAYDTAVENRFALKSLNRIKVTEIKGFLSVKLIFAQQNGIKVAFDANSDIESFSVDSITLARMLGILLDNAIEALTELGHGELLVSFFKTDSGVTLVVQNTCSPNTPPIYELNSTKYISTKGKGRGMGLKILSELIDANPNIVREMRISDNKFIQKIIIQDHIKF